MFTFDTISGLEVTFYDHRETPNRCYHGFVGRNSHVIYMPVGVQRVKRELWI